MILHLRDRLSIHWIDKKLHWHNLGKHNDDIIICKKKPPHNFKSLCCSYKLLSGLLCALWECPHTSSGGGGLDHVLQGGDTGNYTPRVGNYNRGSDGEDDGEVAGQVRLDQ